ncbi:uncharacterized protein LOC141906908 [Tubulanus polymorphus]|uniref:uncharacterized protein LOC141906908 n=1 Tax=Tubulanus polymorphus TaxID=672921 RepID=UPI003DA427A0
MEDNNKSANRSSMFYVALEEKQHFNSQNNQPTKTGSTRSDSISDTYKPIRMGRAKNFLVKKLTATHRKSTTQIEPEPRPTTGQHSQQDSRYQLTFEMSNFVSDFTNFLDSTEKFLKSLKNEPISKDLHAMCTTLRGHITELREYDVGQLLSGVTDVKTTSQEPPPIDNETQQQRKIVHVSPMQAIGLPPELPNRRPSHNKQNIGSGSLDDYNSSGSSGRNTLESSRSTGGCVDTLEDNDDRYDETEVIPNISAAPSQAPQQPVIEVDDQDIYDEFDDICVPEPMTQLFTGEKGKMSEPAQNEPEQVTPNSIGEGTKAGFLTEKKEKKSILGVRGNQKRWCVLDKDIFYTFNDLKAKEPKFNQSIKGYKIVALSQAKNKKQSGFEIYSADGAIVFTFLVFDKEDMISWVEALQNAAGTAPECGTRASIMQDDDGGEIYDDIDIDSAVPAPPSFKPPSRPPVVGMSLEQIYDDAETGLFGDHVLDPVTPTPSDTKDNLYDDGESLQQLPLPARQPTHPSVAADTNIIKGVTTTSSTLDEAEELYDDGISVIPDAQQSSSRVFNFPQPAPVKTPTLVQFKGNEIDEFYLARWDSQATRDDELNFKRGERIKVTNRMNDAHLWWTAESNGKIGLVPKTFLKPAYAKVSLQM